MYGSPPVPVACDTCGLRTTATEADIECPDCAGTLEYKWPYPHLEAPEGVN